MTIGIIGAGICGLIAARELTKNGHQVWLLDKSRGVGGRMATRRVENAVFDHGAQFFTARNADFSALLGEMQEAQITREWYRGYPSNEVKKDETYPRFCGAHGMTDVPKFLAHDLQIHLNETVQRIDWENGQWRVATGNVFWCEALILTPPVPQSLSFFRGNFSLPIVAQRTLEKISYEPCWAVLAQLNGPSKIPAPGALHIEDDVITWIADNYQKGISPLSGSVTIHARGDWTSQHFEDEPQSSYPTFVSSLARLFRRRSGFGKGASLALCQADYNSQRAIFNAYKTSAAPFRGRCFCKRRRRAAC